VKNAPTPTNGTTTLWDTEVTGFGVRVYAGGTRSFFLNYRLNGSETRYTIGKWPDWSVEAACDEARTQRKRIENPTSIAGSAARPRPCGT
jgi:Arm DNA-binding domain